MRQREPARLGSEEFQWLWRPTAPQNTRLHRLSPNRVVFGRENTLPADLVLCDPDTLESSENSVSAFVLQQQIQFRNAYQLARNHLKVAAERRKAYYDIGVRSTKFNVGDRVWYFYPRRYVKRSRKWQFAYVGPYVVAQKLTDLTYLIKKTPKERGICSTR